MFPKIDETPALPFAQLTPQHIVIDLIYNPEQTKLLRIASDCGAKTINGLRMLHQQALKAWDLWQA
jgi:shikimate dehydrogenase